MAPPAYHSSHQQELLPRNAYARSNVSTCTTYLWLWCPPFFRLWHYTVCWEEIVIKLKNSAWNFIPWVIKINPHSNPQLQTNIEKFKKWLSARFLQIVLPSQNIWTQSKICLLKIGYWKFYVVKLDGLLNERWFWSPRVWNIMLWYLYFTIICSQLTVTVKLRKYCLQTVNS